MNFRIYKIVELEGVGMKQFLILNKGNLKQFFLLVFPMAFVVLAYNYYDKNQKTMNVEAPIYEQRIMKLNLNDKGGSSNNNNNVNSLDKYWPMYLSSLGFFIFDTTKMEIFFYKKISGHYYGINKPRIQNKFVIIYDGPNLEVWNIFDKKKVFSKPLDNFKTQAYLVGKKSNLLAVLVPPVQNLKNKPEQTKFTVTNIESNEIVYEKKYDFIAADVNYLLIPDFKGEVLAVAKLAIYNYLVSLELWDKNKQSLVTIKQNSYPLALNNYDVAKPFVFGDLVFSLDNSKVAYAQGDKINLLDENYSISNEFDVEQPTLASFSHDASRLIIESKKVLFGFLDLVSKKIVWNESMNIFKSKVANRRCFNGHRFNHSGPYAPSCDNRDRGFNIVDVSMFGDSFISATLKTSKHFWTVKNDKISIFSLCHSDCPESVLSPDGRYIFNYLSYNKDSVVLYDTKSFNKFEYLLDLN